MPTATPNRPSPSDQLRSTGVMAILRSRATGHVADAAKTLVDAGVTCLEVTLTIPGALDLLQQLRAALPEHVDLGVGTVTNADEAGAAIDAGAGFLVSPAVCLDVVEVAGRRGVAAYPGAWTPTEVLTAWRAGAAAVKVFPAGTGGPAHLHRILDPLPDIPLLPTGGVAVSQVDDYLAAGAFAIGLGSPLLGDALEGGDLGALSDRARQVLATTAARLSG